MADLVPEADDQKLLAQVVDYYHRTLKETTEGLGLSPAAVASRSAKPSTASASATPTARWG